MDVMKDSACIRVYFPFRVFLVILVFGKLDLKIVKKIVQGTVMVKVH